MKRRTRTAIGRPSCPSVHLRFARACGLAVIVASVLPAVARADDQACNGGFEQGQVLRADKRLTEARDQFRSCVNSCAPGAKKKRCSEWLGEIERDIPTVVLSAKDGNGGPLTDVTVSVDGQRLASKLDGTSMEVNPGLHTFGFELPDGTKAQQQVLVEQGKKDVAVSVMLGKPTPPPLTPSPPQPQTETPQQATPPPAPSVSTGSTEAPAAEQSSSAPWKTIGLVGAGVGVIGLGVGTVFGLQAASKKSDAGCDSNSVCPNQAAANTLRDAGSAGNLSTGFFVAGAILAAGGVAMFALAPSSNVQVTPTPTTGGAGLLVRGMW